jgi:hypothetical protein
MRVRKTEGDAMHRIGFAHLIVAAASLVPTAALADTTGPGWKPELGLEEGLSFGGGNVISSDVTGQPALTPGNVSVYAGDTLYLQGYYRQAAGRTGLSLKAAAGMAFACQIPTCLDLLGSAPYQFTTFTGDLAVEYAWQDGRIGVGRTFRYLNDVSSLSSVYSFDDAYLRPAYGWFIEYERGPLGLRYTHVIFHSRSGTAINAGNLGVYVHTNYRDEDWYPGGRFFDQGVGLARQELALVLHPQQWSF